MANINKLSIIQITGAILLFSSIIIGFWALSSYKFFFFYYHTNQVLLRTISLFIFCMLIYTILGLLTELRIKNRELANGLLYTFAAFAFSILSFIGFFDYFTEPGKNRTVFLAIIFLGVPPIIAAVYFYLGLESAKLGHAIDLIPVLKHWHVRHLTRKAKSLNPADSYDIVYLFDRNFVRVSGSGISITQICVYIKNNILTPLNVNVEHGTYLIPNGHCQNMAITKSFSIPLGPAEQISLACDAVCIDATRPIPNSEDTFFAVGKVRSDITRFIIEAEQEGKMTIQAGVWALTDGLSESEIINRLISYDDIGHPVHSISSHDVIKSREILDKLNIAHNL